jgi:hypothetical protein
MKLIEKSMWTCYRSRMNWFMAKVHPARCYGSLGNTLAPDKHDVGGAEQSLPKNLRALLLEYHTVCGRHGFDSMEAAKFLKANSSPEFLGLARALNRLIMKAHLEQEGGNDLTR